MLWFSKPKPYLPFISNNAVVNIVENIVAGIVVIVITIIFTKIYHSTVVKIVKKKAKQRYDAEDYSEYNSSYLASRNTPARKNHRHIFRKYDENTYKSRNKKQY